MHTHCITHTRSTARIRDERVRGRAGKPLAEIKSRMLHDVPVLTADEIEKMRILSRVRRRALRRCVRSDGALAQLGREVLDLAHRMVRPGVTTEEIDAAVHQACIDRECYPSPLNYWSFPKSCCTSVNEVICHGIPDSRPARGGRHRQRRHQRVQVRAAQRPERDVLRRQGYASGAQRARAHAVHVPAVDETSKRLVRCTYDCVMEAIKICKPGTLYREIGNVISQVASQRGFSVVRSYCGHGVGRLFHDNPSVPHYASTCRARSRVRARALVLTRAGDAAENKAVGVMKPGHVFTIEPMINEGMAHSVTALRSASHRAAQARGRIARGPTAGRPSRKTSSARRSSSTRCSSRRCVCRGLPVACAPLTCVGRRARRS
jgi:methionyl aminopeptidase